MKTPWLNCTQGLQDNAAVGARVAPANCYLSIPVYHHHMSLQQVGSQKPARPNRTHAVHCTETPLACHSDIVTMPRMAGVGGGEEELSQNPEALTWQGAVNPVMSLRLASWIGISWATCVCVCV